MYEQILEDAIFVMFYAVVMTMALMAGAYLLFRRGNAFAEDIASRVTTASNLRASAAYRTHLIRVLTARAVQKLGTLGGDCT